MLACVLLAACRAEDAVAIAVLQDAGQESGAGTSPSSGTAGSSSSTASCDDSMRDQGESDVDCGGPCSACGLGAACASNDDCVSESCADGKCAASLVVYYTTAARSDLVPMVRPVFEIHNEGASPVPLSELEIRYFFTNEGSGSPQSQCPILGAGCDVAQLSFAQLMPVRPLADTYLSVTFSASAPSIAPSSSSGRYEVGFRNDGIGLCQQSNDYSFDSDTDLIDAVPSDKICLYRNGKLVWGVEPAP